MTRCANALLKRSWWSHKAFLVEDPKTSLRRVWRESLQSSDESEFGRIPRLMGISCWSNIKTLFPGSKFLYGSVVERTNLKCESATQSSEPC